MQIGLIGCGNMARALARGWGRPVLCADPYAERARSAGGRRSAARRSPATPRSRERADLVVLCHKPAQLRAVAERARGPGRSAVASILAATPLADLRAAYPGRPVYRFMPSLPVEVRQGAVVQAAGARAGPGASTRERVASCSPSSARWWCSTTRLVDVAMGLMSCAPAYVALVAEAQIDAGVRRGIPAAQGAELVVADARRDGRAAAPARQRHDGGPPRGRPPRAG